MRNHVRPHLSRMQTTLQDHGLEMAILPQVGQGPDLRRDQQGMSELTYPILIFETASSIVSAAQILGVKYQAEVLMLPGANKNEVTKMAVDFLMRDVWKAYPNAYLRAPNYIVIE